MKAIELIGKLEAQVKINGADMEVEIPCVSGVLEVRSNGGKWRTVPRLSYGKLEGVAVGVEASKIYLIGGDYA